MLTTDKIHPTNRASLVNRTLMTWDFSHLMHKRRIPRWSRIKCVVLLAFLVCTFLVHNCVGIEEGEGAAKLVCSLRENYVGLSRVRVQNIPNFSQKNTFAKFLNKATIKPIRARDVQVKHQINLMDTGKKGVVKMNGKCYRYVLSVIDVFSRFVWLRALTTKCSTDISKELQTIYMEHGPPTMFQSDQGSVFKGAMKKLLHQTDGHQNDV